MARKYDHEYKVQAVKNCGYIQFSIGCRDLRDIGNAFF